MKMLTPKIGSSTYQNKAYIVYSHKVGNIAVLIFGFFLLCFYLSNIEKIYTIWELDDEAQFLFNASLLSGQNWKDAFSNLSSYYGIGYSILLIPFFYICDTGLELIRCANILNALIVLLTYFLQVHLFVKLFPQVKKALWGFLALIACMYPYIVASSTKVICETFLTMQIWVIAVSIYYLVRTNKLQYHVLFGGCVTFIFFIHTRSLGTIAVALLLYLCYMVSQDKTWKYKLLCLSSFCIVCIVLYLLLNGVKMQVLEVLGSGKLVEKDTPKINLINSSFVLDRIKWLLSPENLSIYLHSFLAKIFYLIISTAGVFVFGFTESIKYIIRKIKKFKGRCNEKVYIFLFFLLQLTVTLILCLAVGTGETYEFFIYGRYFEYTVGFFVIYSLYVLMEKNHKWKTLLVVFFGVSLLGGITANLSSFETSDAISMDTNRLAALSYSIERYGNWVEAILSLAITLIICICIFKLVQKKNLKKYIIPVLVLLFFWKIDTVVLNQIDHVNVTNKTDVELADLVHESFKDLDIYFVYENYKYPSFFVRMQVFLKDEVMHVVAPEEICGLEETAVIITYRDSDFSEQIKRSKKYRYIDESNVYEVFLKM